MAQGEGDPDSPRHSALGGDGTFRGLRSARRVLGGNTGFFPVSHPLRSLAASSLKREWVRAGNQIGISESQGSVLTACLLLTVIVGL